MTVTSTSRQIVKMTTQYQKCLNIVTRHSINLISTSVVAGNCCEFEVPILVRIIFVPCIHFSTVFIKYKHVVHVITKHFAYDEHCILSYTELHIISTMISLSGVIGSCGKRCIGCGKQENLCMMCGEPKDRHKKKPHKPVTKPLRNSHAYSNKMLQRVWDNKDEEVIWDATKGPEVARRKPSTCYWSLLCEECEQSISAIEGNMCKRHDDGYYESKEDGVIHPEDVRALCVFTYRALPVNINILHFLLYEGHHNTLRDLLLYLRKAFTPPDTSQGTTQPSDPIKSFEKRMLYKYHHFTDEHNVEFSFFCEVDLTSIGLGHEWLVYGQMPPYYWAFPFNRDKCGRLQPYFRQIIECINSQLEQERGQYYDQCPEAQQRRSTTKLVVGYLRRLNKHCVRVKIPPQSAEHL